MKEEARELDSKRVALAAEMPDEEHTSEYFGVLQQLERTREEIRRVIQRPEHCLPYLQVEVYWSDIPILLVALRGRTKATKTE